MCLTESVSWTTLIIGTITNIIILIYLSRMIKKDVNAITRCLRMEISRV
jgi:multisubunit Na+/H+ antiporter MnhE subunit